MRTTLRAAAALAVTALALAGCGGTTATTSTSTPAVTATQTASWPSVRAIAAQIGATGVQIVPPTMYASDEANAVWHDRNVDIATFASAQLRDSWVQVAGQFTPIMTQGPRFAVADDGPAS